MVERLSARGRRGEGDLELGLQPLLPDELAQEPGTKREILVPVLQDGD